MKISSPAFHDKATIPSKYGCDGADTNPRLEIEDVPAGTETLSLIIDDPDAPGHTFVHWVVFNIDPTDAIEADSVPGVQGHNDFGREDYGGPCPPSGAHRYYFKLYALDSRLDLPAGSTKGELLRAMEGHILDEAELIGLYSR